ncbi:MAG TPA: cysteine synthase family protein [Elusimicrobiota bacterium]|nr:cysteine synthase family protein [Elusimicrobiota bacterium]
MRAQASPTTEQNLGVGNTPLISFPKLARSLGDRVEIVAKAEWHNPGGSIKDRPALRMLRQAERDGRLSPGKIIMDATSGNTGIAYAWMGAKLGYKVRLAVPGNINVERKKILLAYGAELILTDPLEGPDGAIHKAQELNAANPELYFYPDQYNNPENWKAHHKTTGPEIWEQTQGRVTHFIAGLGTSGTFRGAGARLKELSPGVKLISVQPDSPLHGLEGLKHMDSAIVPGIYDPRQADQNLEIATEEAYEWVLRAAKEEGVLIGISGGANLAACFKVGQKLFQDGQDAVVATVLPDGGERYLSERFWEQAK